MQENEFTSAVFAFNKTRNVFDLKGDNEINMLKEESKEFFIDSKTTAERLDGLVDFEFVFFGTQMNISANFAPIDPMLGMMCNDTIEVMKSTLMGELNLDEDAFEEVHAKARKIVVECNELKGKDLDKNGKVKKPKNLPNATVHIEKMLSEILD